MRAGIVQRKCACGGTPGPTGECEACRKKRLQRKAAYSSVGSQPAVAPQIVRDVLSSPGQALDKNALSSIECRFGRDFSNVRVHTDAQAAQSAQAVNALAYTVGRDIVFGDGLYSPGTIAGRRLIAHELTHVAQQSGNSLTPALLHVGSEADPAETEADRASRAVETADSQASYKASISQESSRKIRRRVRPENVSCHDSGLTNPNLTGTEAVAAITDADADAIILARQAEQTLTTQLAAARAGDPIDAATDTILQEELGLTLTNRAQFGLIQQQIGRFRRVRETLESGYLRYICRGDGSITLVGCTQGSCGTDFAFSCPGNRLIVLCQAFWDTADQRSATVLHEPFHIWFDMARHAPNALRRADASCFESFALRVSGRAAFASCAGHTAG
ncbi:MAG TPA: DUF4157 domain-containing protein [Chthoniobacterales bacterium]|jgi:hypothetical protein